MQDLGSGSFAGRISLRRGAVIAGLAYLNLSGVLMARSGYLPSWLGWLLAGALEDRATMRCHEQRDPGFGTRR